MRQLKLILPLYLVVTASFAAESAPKQISLAKLHQNYVKANYSTADLPEFNKRISMAGVALGLTTSFAGGSGLLKAGAAGSEDVLARLVARDAANEARMGTLNKGAAFKATCTVAFASGADYIPLQDCVFD